MTNGEYDDIPETESLTQERISRMSEHEIEQFRRDRAADFARSLGVSKEKAKRMADSEIDSAIEGAEFEKERDMERLLREQDRKLRIKQPKQPKQEREEIEEEEEEPVTRREKLLWKGEKSVEEEETPDERDEYLRTRQKIVHGLQKSEQIGKGIVGLGSRRPVKEALISGAAAAFLALKGKPKTPQEIREAKEEAKRIRAHREEERHVERLAMAETAGERPYQPQLRDIGRGDMGSRKFGTTRNPVGDVGRVVEPDFFGTRSFGIGTTPSRKTKIIKKIYVKQRSPSTSIYMLSKPPSVSLGGFDINKPPSTSFGMGRLMNPLGEPKSRSIKIKGVKFTKPKKTQQKDASEILGLKGFW